MLIHDVNKRLVDLRYSEFDDSEMEALRKKKEALEKKIETAKAKKPDYEKELEKLESDIKALEDETEEERRAGRARFKTRAYINYKGKNRRPPYHFTWVRYTPTNDYREYNQWITGYGYSPVKYGKDPFYPEGAKVNQANLWQFGDLVWVKRDLKEYLLEKVAEKKRTISGQNVIDRVQAQMEREGASIPRQQLAQLKDMAQQIEDHGHQVEDSVLTSLGI